MNRRALVTALAVGTALAWSGMAVANQPATRPNFLLLISDDQNWNGLSVRMDPLIEGSRSQIVETPSIARLAREGMRFTQAYAPAPVCSPTRVSWQTGKSPAQLHWTKAAPNVEGGKLITPISRRQLSDSETTIGEFLKQAGYATAHYGKWHLGGGGPAAHGYDDGDGDTGNHDAAPFVSPNPVDIFGMGDRAAAFMENSRQIGRPFFVQLSYYALHYPQNADPKTIAKYRAKRELRNNREILRAAIAEDLDRGIGNLMAAVKQLGLDDNTYVLFMSDNGGGGKRGVLRGGKGSLNEGGIRVPFILRGPGIKPGSVSDVPVVGYDLFPTLAALSGSEQPLPRGVEGGSFASLLSGRSASVRRPRLGLIFHFPHYQDGTPHSAVRLGKYKLIKYYEDDRVELYDLENDLRESNDLASVIPEKANELRVQLEQYLSAVGAKLPEVNPNYDPANAATVKKGGNRGKRKDQRRSRRAAAP